jgi:dipeptidyl aminopeptidase/acylaminoacyl peptidase
MHKKIIFLLVLLCSVTYSKDKLFQPHDVFRTLTVEETAISPDGEFAAFTLRNPRPFSDGPGSAYEELYAFNYRDMSVIPLLTGNVTVDDVSWTNDSKFVSFTSKLGDDDVSQIYKISLDGNDTVRVTDWKTSVINYQWHPGENKVAFMAKEYVEKPEHEILGFDQEVFEENIPGRNLYLLDLNSGNVVQLNASGAVFDFQWSPDGSSIAAAVAPRNLVDDSYMFTRLKLIDPASGSMSDLVENPGKLGSFEWSPDGKSLAFISGADKNDAVDGSLFICEVPNSTHFTGLKNYSADFVGSVVDVDWLNEETVLFVSEEGVHTTLRKQRIGSDQSELVINPGETVFKSISKSNGKIVFAGETSGHPKELYTHDLESRQASRNTFHNEWLKYIKLAKQETIEYKASDGLKIEGLLFYPVNFVEGKKYPMITYIHGGPESTNSYGWNTGYNRWGQSAAAKDFFVFMPNYRAGSGRGNKFTMMGFADAGGREFVDVLDGIDYLVDKGYVDREKVGIGGGSYGGYFSAWAASRHTEHFAAAVSFVGIGNQLVKRNTTDIPWESYLVHWGYWVNENPMEVYDRSPVRYAEKMNTPLLLLHGNKDPRVHPSQSLEMYRAFKLKGNAPVRLVWYEGEGHGNRKNTNRLDYHLRTLEWFEYYLKGENSKDSMPPNVIDYKLESLKVKSGKERT